ncbi:hypothetical protein MBLNU457_6193t1 [Dothideomycetes sp. NU457]
MNTQMSETIDHSHSMEESSQSPTPSELHVHCRDGTSTSYNLDCFTAILEKAPTLAEWLKTSNHIHRTTREAVEALLLYISTAAYLPPMEDETLRPLLFHLEVYYLSQRFDIDDLRKQAHGQVTCELDVSWAKTDPLPDLVPAIRFVYDHLSDQMDLRSTFAHYAVNCYHRHRLDQSEDFLALAYDQEAFHADLCSTNIAHQFEDDSAAAIVRLPIKPSNKQSSLPIELPELSDDAVDEMWRASEGPLTPQGACSPSSSPEVVTPPAWNQAEFAQATVTSDDEQGWVLPLRPATARHETANYEALLREDQDLNLAPTWKHLRPSKQDALRSAAAGIKEARGRDDLEHKSNEIDPYGHVARLLTAGHGQSQLDQLEVVSLPSSPDIEEKDGFMLV